MNPFSSIKQYDINHLRLDYKPNTLTIGNALSHLRNRSKKIATDNNISDTTQKIIFYSYLKKKKKKTLKEKKVVRK